MNNIDFAPLKLDKSTKNFWFWYNEELDEKFNKDETDEYQEMSLSKEGDIYTLEYRDECCCMEIWEGNIPDRAFFELLLKNNLYTKELNLV